MSVNQANTQANANASACSTHVLFNPGNHKTAEDYSKRYGEKEVLIKNRTTGQTSGGGVSPTLGGQMSRSISWSENLQKMPVISADEILKFPQGKCVITSPGYSSGGQASIPYPLIIPVSKADEKLVFHLFQQGKIQTLSRFSKQ